MPEIDSLDWTNELVEQLDYYWREFFRPRLRGLTDEEYLWEPVPGCWTIRPGATGRHTYDYEQPAPEPPPVTTIAWRLCHIAGPVLALRSSEQFEDASIDLRDLDWPATAASGIAFAEDAYRRWITGVRRLDPSALARPMGPREGPWALRPLAALVLHISREVIHHGGEIGCLRDLYRAGAPQKRSPRHT